MGNKNEDFNVLFGRFVIEARTKLDITQEKAADLAEVSYRTYQRIEAGESEPKNYTIYKLSHALHINIHQVYAEIRNRLS
ncbi:helix-turn-helix domain-containing protein [Aquibacillus koreensis]|uniref:Helix-turn-helix domain-containing protein n=1 Tax=Aquibacillus koreensis TaxID=279446 RepID=A0A9X3WK94_9BACI|nr:helix-turn-helix transcriptional regulator [Aquibacillus koreensis]MCT2534657.1 helix-turn-helix domain-containing protein [Aquibacillus koreensis]MDC3419841.1 helix-turn-helix domain-containing protein [Aquibacillus koreensis]